MREEEDWPRRPGAGRQRLEPAVLDSWGIEELRDYIAALEAEIARAEAAIAVRERQRGAADALFRKD